MSRVLILSWDGGGNTPSAFNLGSRLVRRGHRVRMVGWDTMAVRAAAAGLEFATYPSVAPWPAALRHEDGWERIEAALFGARTEADVVAEATTFRADVLVVDCMLTAGYAAAHRLGLPVVSLVHVRYAPFVHEWGSAVLKTDVVALLDASRCVLALQPPASTQRISCAREPRPWAPSCGRARPSALTRRWPHDSRNPETRGCCSA